MDKIKRIYAYKNTNCKNNILSATTILAHAIIWARPKYAHSGGGRIPLRAIPVLIAPPYIGPGQWVTGDCCRFFSRFLQQRYLLHSGSNLFTRLNYWIVACGGQPEVTPPTLLGVENPSSATIVCQGNTFTFKLDQALADNGGIFLVIEATEGQSNGVSRAHSKAVAIKMVEEP